MGLKKLDHMFNPKSIAVIGASNRKDSVGYGVMKNLKEGDFDGKIYPINIKRNKVQGLKAYKSVKDINNEINLAIIATPASTVIDLVKECGKKNVLNVIIMSSGFKEIGKKGNEDSKKILNIARSYNMRVMGPNCMGFIKPSMNLNATFANEMPKKGNIAFISQSGALGSATLDWAREYDFGFSFFASLGSMIDISFHDVIDYLGKDPYTKSIIIYMESLEEARKFLSAARSFSRTKPIVVLKSGKSDQGAKAALSHTGCLAGNDEVFDAAFKRAGIIRVNEIDDLFDCARTLSKQKRPRGNKLAIITNAGGPGVISTDYLIERNGKLAELSDKTISKLNKDLPKNWSGRNPVDILGDANAKDYKKAVQTCIEDKNVDGVLVILTPQSMTDSVKIAEEISSIKEGFEKPILASWMGGQSIKKGSDILEKKDIPVFAYPEKAIKSFIYLYNYMRNLELLYQTPATIPHAFNPRTNENKKIIEKIKKEKRNYLKTEEVKKFLENYFIPMSKSGLAKSPKEAGEISDSLGYPVAMKVISPDITHKTDVEGVELNIFNKEDVIKTFNKINKKVKKNKPKAKIQGVLIDQMDSKDYELLIGCKKDPIFGPSIVFGMGGVAVNVFRDIKIGLPPLNMALSQRLIEETKIYNLLKGYRNMQGVDLEALRFLLYKFAYLIMDFPEIKEIDLNPFKIDKTGGLVVDANIVLDKKYLKKKTEEKRYSHLVISPYPKEYIKEIKLKNKKKVILRPIKPEDEPLEKKMFEEMSKKTQRFRFFGQIKDITHKLLIRYTQIDYDREIAIIAETKVDGKKKMAGVARIISDPYDDSAEFAIVVADPYQNKGIGSELMNYILNIAREKNIKYIYAYFLEDNDIMGNMFEKRGFRIIKEEDSYKAELMLE